jgi:hypothetical protein
MGHKPGRPHSPGETEIADLGELTEILGFAFFASQILYLLLVADRSDLRSEIRVEVSAGVEDLGHVRVADV